MNNLGFYFRTIRESKNISISSLADEYISKGMISKFEREESDISTTRFFHLLEKIKISPNEYFFLKNQYKSDDFEEILTTIQQCVLSGNTKKLVLLLDKENTAFTLHENKFHKLNCIMIKAVLKEISANQYQIDSEEIEFIIDYLFRCENWYHYEMILYANSMGALPIESIIAFSKNIPQKIMLMKNSGKMLEIGFNVILNTLGLCIKNNYKDAAHYFLSSLDNLTMPEVMLFEHTLLRLYKGAFLKKFAIDITEGDKLITDSLLVFQLTQCTELYDIFFNTVNEILV
ncbi:Rgg family transcriptional regulator [Tuanshanicoccus lijuaniae]|uniref:Rgg family transcriptional regulator n=1 Tax=Aerococcaceae bacterium zg-1292 TaxID=2774330 RepID=UPI001BD8FE24|nr:hypothetical protein [Aerococcaceae bacterium zg-A91]MBS4458812.1 hypothetical protein [Aerococcaceae bacterium zg-BR33]